MVVRELKFAVLNAFIIAQHRSLAKLVIERSSLSVVELVNVNKSVY